MAEEKILDSTGSAEFLGETDTHDQNHTLSDNLRCQVCQVSRFKYKCPRCLTKTCSLSCTKQHKQDKECSGVRDKTAYVPLGKYTPNHMASDYCFLEDAYRVADNASRHNPASAVPKSDSLPMSKKDHILHKESRNRKIQYKAMPKGMTRHEQNKSMYIIKDRMIYWTLEWTFEEDQTKLLTHQNSETCPLSKLFADILTEKPGNMSLLHTLKKTRCLAQAKLEVLLVNEKSGSSHADVLDWNTNLAEALQGRTVIEFPRLIVRKRDDATELADQETTDETQQS